MKPVAPKRQRCAIYTRKSTDHNLDLAFNSLDAQREACEAYIKSQAHEGWTLVPTAFDDGGLSGASLDRPALQLLLDAVRARKLGMGKAEGAGEWWKVAPAKAGPCAGGNEGLCRSLELAWWLLAPLGEDAPFLLRAFWEFRLRCF